MSFNRSSFKFYKFVNLLSLSLFLSLGSRSLAGCSTSVFLNTGSPLTPPFHDPTLRDFLLFAATHLDFFRSTFRADAHNRTARQTRMEEPSSGKYLQLTLHNKRIPVRHYVHGPADPGPAGEETPTPTRPVTCPTFETQLQESKIILRLRLLLRWTCIRKFRSKYVYVHQLCSNIIKNLTCNCYMWKILNSFSSWIMSEQQRNLRRKWNIVRYIFFFNPFNFAVCFLMSSSIYNTYIFKSKKIIFKNPIMHI